MKEFLYKDLSKCWYNQGQSYFIDIPRACMKLKVSPYELEDTIESKWSCAVTIRPHKPAIAIDLHDEFFHITAKESSELAKRLFEKLNEITKDQFNKVDQVSTFLSYHHMINHNVI